VSKSNRTDDEDDAHVAVPASTSPPDRAGGEVLPPVFVAGGGSGLVADGCGVDECDVGGASSVADVSVGECGDDGVHGSISGRQRRLDRILDGSVGPGQYSGERRPRWYVAVINANFVLESACRGDDDGDDDGSTAMCDVM
jgi:hypothetical protein